MDKLMVSVTIRILLVSFLLAFLPQVSLAEHDFSGRCKECHVPHGMGVNLQVVFAQADRLCSECHPVAIGQSHPIGIVPSLLVPAGFPLGEKGQIGCVTCHNPHRDSKESAAMLRGFDQGIGFCEKCHVDAIGEGAEHFAAIPLAHHQGVTSPEDGTPEPLDLWSQACLDCHDEGDGHYFCFPGDVKECKGHPLGMSYPVSGGGKGKLKPIAKLDPAMSLREGKIGCLTCHTPFGKAPHLLVIDNAGSRLCLNCHLY